MHAAVEVSEIAFATLIHNAGISVVGGTVSEWLLRVDWRHHSSYLTIQPIHPTLTIVWISHHNWLEQIEET